jgi:7-cyano-7-deazaguanine synthase
MPSSILLLSAGLDSIVNLKRAVDEGTVRATLTFDYGQRAAVREIERSAAACRRLGVRCEVIPLPWMKRITKSALVRRGAAVPKPKAERLDDPSSAARSATQVWVPNRNGVFLAVGASFAEAVGADQVVAGFNAEEAASFPDNSIAFLNASNRALRFSTMTGVRAVSYTSRLRKRAIVRLGLKIGAPMDLVWPCYFGRRAPCGECESCKRFLRAVREAGVADHPAFSRKGRR